MSRIQLQWEIESDASEKVDSEDPKAKHARQRAATRLALLFALLTVLALAGSLLLRQRYQDLERALEDSLRQTVYAEVASLRIGDLNTWLSIQLGADDESRRRQLQTFQRYSDLKAKRQIVLTGEIRELEITGDRARVMLDETVNGATTAVVWHYAHTDGRWRRIAAG